MPVAPATRKSHETSDIPFGGGAWPVLPGISRRSLQGAPASTKEVYLPENKAVSARARRAGTPCSRRIDLRWTPIACSRPSEFVAGQLGVRVKWKLWFSFVAPDVGGLPQTFQLGPHGVIILCTNVASPDRPGHRRSTLEIVLRLREDLKD